MVWRILQERVLKILITDLDELKQRQLQRTEWAQLDHVVIAAAIRQWRRRYSSRSVTRVLCTFFHNFVTRCNQLDSNLDNLEAKVEVGYILELLSLTMHRYSTCAVSNSSFTR